MPFAELCTRLSSTTSHPQSASRAQSSSRYPFSALPAGVRRCGIGGSGDDQRFGSCSVGLLLPPLFFAPPRPRPLITFLVTPPRHARPGYPSLLSPSFSFRLPPSSSLCPQGFSFQTSKTHDKKSRRFFVSLSSLHGSSLTTTPPTQPIEKTIPERPPRLLSLTLANGLPSHLSVYALLYKTHNASPLHTHPLSPLPPFVLAPLSLVRPVLATWTASSLSNPLSSGCSRVTSEPYRPQSGSTSTPLLGTFTRISFRCFFLLDHHSKRVGQHGGHARACSAPHEANERPASSPKTTTRSSLSSGSSPPFWEA